MNQKEWNEGLNYIDIDLVEKYVLQKDRLRQKNSRRKKWIRLGAAACFALIVSAIIVVPMLLKDSTVIPEPDNFLPQIPTTSSGSKITGMYEIQSGTPASPYSNDKMPAIPSFPILTVIEAKVIEVLPDTYRLPNSGTVYRIARLEVVDQIHGSDLPSEIFLRFAHHHAAVFDGYDTFIFSLKQIGVENYLMVNRREKEMVYFPNMFKLCNGDDLYFGCAIAFNNGKVDVNFWDASAYDKLKYNLSNPENYPVSVDTTLKQAKANVITLSKSKQWADNANRSDYVTADDVFAAGESKGIREYVAPSETNFFMHSIDADKNWVFANYTRVINGFVTEEVILLNREQNGTVERRGEAYTEKDLQKLPDIGTALYDLKLPDIAPPHIEITNEMYISYRHAQGFYQKANGKTYGIIRIIWEYSYHGIDNCYISDDCYYLYDEDGNGRVVERDELKEIIGENNRIIASFEYEPIYFDI